MRRQLIRHLHESLVLNLRADIERRGQPLPPEGTRHPRLAGGSGLAVRRRGVSHRRLAPFVGRPHGLAGDRTGGDPAGRRADRLRTAALGAAPYEAEPPFERTYEDHAVFLRALLGQDVEAAIAHFRGKLPTAGPGRLGGHAAGCRCSSGSSCGSDRLDEAIDVAAEHLAGVPESALFCPSLPQLCRRGSARSAGRGRPVAGRPGQLRGGAAGHGGIQGLVTSNANDPEREARIEDAPQPTHGPMPARSISSRHW